jgi:phage tail-like protein
MPISNPLDPAIITSFSVMIDNKISLGSFSSCEGLGLEVVMEAREEGGNNSFVHQLPVRIKYPNIKLSRPVDEQSRLISDWLNTMHGTITRTTAEIIALNWIRPVTSWKLQGVIPARWQGPQMSADNNKVSVETLELAHHGFL